MKADTPPDLPDARFALLGEADRAALQRLLELCTDFKMLVTGAPATPEAAAELLTDRPPGHPLEKKLVLGVLRDGDLVAAIELLRDYPEPGRWYLGLLLLTPAARNAGLGARLMEALRAWIAARGGRAIRLVVQEQNEAGARFWRRMGFQPIGTAVQPLKDRTNTVTRMELQLSARDA